MNRKQKISAKVKTIKEELNDFSIRGIWLLIGGIISIFINGINWINICFIILSIIIIAVRTRGMIIFLGLLELIFGIYLIIIFFNYGSDYSIWKRLVIVIFSIWLIWEGINLIKRYYNLKN